MIDNEFVKEAREANAKGLDAGYTVSELLKVIDQQQADIESLKTAYETLKQEYDSMFSANRNLMAEVERLQKFKHYFDDLYALGLEIANWHHNGKLEPFDNFYDSAIKEMTERKDEGK